MIAKLGNNRCKYISEMLCQIWVRQWSQCKYYNRKNVKTIKVSVLNEEYN